MPFPATESAINLDQVEILTLGEPDREAQLHDDVTTTVKELTGQAATDFHIQFSDAASATNDGKEEITPYKEAMADMETIDIAVDAAAHEHTTSTEPRRLVIVDTRLKDTGDARFPGIDIPLRTLETLRIGRPTIIDQNGQQLTLSMVDAKAALLQEFQSALQEV